MQFFFHCANSYPEYLRFTTTLNFIFHTRSTQGGTVKAKGTIYLSNIRMVFVAKKPVGNLFAFDMPLVRISSTQYGLLFRP